LGDQAGGKGLLAGEEEEVELVLKLGLGLYALVLEDVGNVFDFNEEAGLAQECDGLELDLHDDLLLRGRLLAIYHLEVERLVQAPEEEGEVLETQHQLVVLRHEVLVSLLALAAEVEEPEDLELVGLDRAGRLRVVQLSHKLFDLLVREAKAGLTLDLLFLELLLERLVLLDLVKGSHPHLLALDLRDEKALLVVHEDLLELLLLPLERLLEEELLLGLSEQLRGIEEGVDEVEEDEAEVTYEVVLAVDLVEEAVVEEEGELVAQEIDHGHHDLHAVANEVHHHHRCEDIGAQEVDAQLEVASRVVGADQG